MPAIAPKPPTPTEDELLWRRCLAVQLAMTCGLSEMTLHERTLLAQQCLFIRFLVRTGRFSELTS